MKIIKNQAGQAMVEYILILVVTVGLVGLLATRIYKPFSKYASFLVNEYTQCLLDEGRLPGRTVDCDNELKQNPITSGIGTGNGSDPAGGAGSAKNNRTDKERTPDRYGDGAGGGSGGGSGAAGNIANAMNARSRRSGNEARSGSKRSQIATDRRGGADENSTSVESSGDEMSASDIYNRYGRGRKTRAIAFTGKEITEKLKKDKAAERRSSFIRSKEETQLEELRARKMAVKPPVVKAKLMGGEEGFKFSLGGLFRFAIIAIILVGVIYVLGTQVNSVMKGMDK